MPGKTSISWATDTWNPVTGCSHVSEGCRFCYAERLSLEKGWSTLPWTERNAEQNIKLRPERLDQVFRWKKPRLIFVNSMSDLFHPLIPFSFIDMVFAAMIRGHWHIYQILTKRPERMLEYMLSRAKITVHGDPECPDDLDHPWMEAAQEAFGEEIGNDVVNLLLGSVIPHVTFPPPHIWLGVSAEDQRTADERIPLLRQTPAAVRWVSAEPLLGPMDIHRYLSRRLSLSELSGQALNDGALEGRIEGIDWVVAGGESGPGARPMNPDWVRFLRSQCQAADVPFHFKQWGEWSPDRDAWKTYAQSSPDRRIPAQQGQASYRFPRRLVDGTEFDDGNGEVVYRVGKPVAGRLLDGKQWGEFPPLPWEGKP